MAINYNDNLVNRVFYENHDCDRVYWNNHLVLQKDSVAPFFIENTSDSRITIDLVKYSSLSGYYITKDIKYSFNGMTNWKTWSDNLRISLSKKGSRIYISSNDTNPFWDYTTYPVTVTAYTYFSMSGTVKLGGSIKSLFDNASTVPENGCRGLFSHTYSTRITDISELVFPQTTSTYCYADMFNGCTAITKLPVLPATTLANYCYSGMFANCTGIMLSETQTAEYPDEYRIPSSGTGTASTYSLNNMFTGTGGTFTGTPNINQTYYTNATIIS